jgi:hypothetical protein
MHAGEERVASGSATLLGKIVHELGTFLPNAVDVGRFPNHQSLVVDARLHPADVIPHDEEDVGLLLLRRSRRDHRRHSSEKREQTKKEVSKRTHGRVLLLGSLRWSDSLCPVTVQNSRSASRSAFMVNAVRRSG